VRFDAPSQCADLLHAGEVDLGMIPSIEYLHETRYDIVPNVAIASEGSVASVALFTRRPIATIRSIAADTSSRTSAALLRVLCARRFGIAPEFVKMVPDFSSMLTRCDAALVIGDPALFADHRALGLHKIDLGAEWTAMTGLPFVWAFWAGSPEVATPAHVQALATARDTGVAAAEAIGQAYSPGDAERGRIGGRYLRENIRFDLGVRELDGLRTYYQMARDEGITPRVTPVSFFAIESTPMAAPRA
jgi:chorismate dehydratase